MSRSITMRQIRSLQTSLPLLLLLLAALGASACKAAEPTASAADEAATADDLRVDVPAVAATTTDLESTLQVSGSLQPQARVAVMARQPGTLLRVAVDIGDRVRKGQVVATLDRRELDAQVDVAKGAVGVADASLDAAEAALGNASTELERAKNLFEKGAVARQRLDAAETAAHASSAQRDLARATLAQAEAALRRAVEVQRDATLTSPIDGVVVERNFDAGSHVSPNELPVVTVADLRVLKLEAGVSELEAGRLAVGMPARVTVQARPGEVFEGRIAAMSPEVDPKNRHFAIEIRTMNPAGTILSGMYATAQVPIERAAGVVAVPRAAVTSRDNRRVVLRITDNVVTEVPVTEGLSDGTSIQIASGLASGDLVVADARRDVAAGTKVNPVLVK